MFEATFTFIMFRERLGDLDLKSVGDFDPVVFVHETSWHITEMDATTYVMYVISKILVSCAFQAHAPPVTTGTIQVASAVVGKEV